MEEESKVGIILQARMGSSRLPGKVLLPFGKTTLLGWIINRLNNLPWQLVVATSNLEQDKAIIDYCQQLAVDCYVGSEEDVLDRYYQCATEYAFDHVIRLTADNPFTDVEELTRLVKLHLDGKSDYCHNFGKLPVGVGAEIFTIKALTRSWHDGVDPQHREHVNEFILENPNKFRIAYLETAQKKQQPKLALTIDTEQDYQRIKKCLAEMNESKLTTEDIIKQCSLSA